MYKLKPIFEVPVQIQNTCQVYKLKNLHEKPVQNKSDANKFTCDLTQLSDQELDALLSKEQIDVSNVLKTLEQLQDRLIKLDVPFLDKGKNVSNSEKQSAQPNPCGASQTLNPKINDIGNLTKEVHVVFADPDDPPYTLLALPILWPVVAWNISYHVHSSLTKDLKDLKKIEAFKNIPCHENENTTVKVVVIWQSTNPSPKMLKSSTDVIFGEVPLLMLFKQYLTTAKIIDANSNNNILDLINDIRCSTNDHTSELYSLISDTNPKFNIENIAIWSLLYKKNKNPPNIEKWLEQLTKIIIS